MPTLAELAKKGQLQRIAQYLRQELSPLDFERAPESFEARIEDLLAQAIKIADKNSQLPITNLQSISNDQIAKQSDENKFSKPLNEIKTDFKAQSPKPQITHDQKQNGQASKAESKFRESETIMDNPDVKIRISTPVQNPNEPKPITHLSANTKHQAWQASNFGPKTYPEKSVTSNTQPKSSGNNPAFRWVAESIASANHSDRNEDHWGVLDVANMAWALDGIGNNAAAAETSRWVSASFIKEITDLIKSGDQVSDWPGAMRELLLTTNTSLRQAIETDKKLSGGATTAAIIHIDEAKADRKLTYSIIGDTRVSIWRPARNRYGLAILDDQILRLLLAPVERRPAWLKPLLAKHGLSSSLKLDVPETARLATILDQDPNPGRHDATAKFLFDERAIVTQVLGAPTVSPHVGQIEIEAGDRILLATDGIHDNLTEGELIGILSRTKIDEVASALVVRASEIAQSAAPRAKKDDMTAVVLEIK